MGQATTKTPPAEDETTLKLIGIEEAGRLLSLSRTAIYGLMDGGELRYVKLGRSRRLRLSDVRALIERSTVSRPTA